MKKFVELSCTICKRTKDALVRTSHYSPDRCTITLNCEGRLVPIGYTSEGTSVLSVPPTGLSNWYARGSTLTSTAALQDPVLYDTSTGTKKQVVLAVPNSALGFVPASTATLTLNLIAEQQTSKDFRQYTFRRTGILTVLNGVEDSQAKKVLRYNVVGVNPDLIDVYVNGVKRDRGTGASEYRVFDEVSGSPVPPNSILFNTPVTGTNNQIDVIVTKASTISTAALVFRRAINDEARAETGAWEGISAVKSAAVGQWSLFYCDFADYGSALALGIKLRVNTATPSFVQNSNAEGQVPITQMSLLLSRTRVHTQLDRQRSKWIPINVLNSNTDYLVVKLIDGARTLLVTEDSAVDLFPVLDVIRFRAPVLQTTNLLGDIDSAELENDLILGPDV